MSIVVSCECGKRFKAKDSLAGKKVRCPGCQEPVLVKSREKKAPSATKADIEAAMAKYEAAQAKKVQSAEDEAKYREEANKLIESYDALAGKNEKNSKKKKKGELAESEEPKKPTVVTHAADAGGTVAQNPWVRYLVVVALLGGGAYGVAMGVKYIVNYTQDEVTAQVPAEQKIKELEIEARRAIISKEFAKANDIMKDILDIDPTRERHRNYKDLEQKLAEAMKGE